MRLTWKDATATLFVAVVGALYVAFLAGVDLPVVSGTRALAGAVLLLGVGACATGASPEQPTGARRRWLSTLGALTGVAGLGAVIIGSEALLAVLVGGTVLLWLVTTVGRMVTRPRQESMVDAAKRS